MGDLSSNPPRPRSYTGTKRPVWHLHRSMQCNLQIDSHCSCACRPVVQARAKLGPQARCRPREFPGQPTTPSDGLLISPEQHQRQIDAAEAGRRWGPLAAAEPAPEGRLWRRVEHQRRTRSQRRPIMPRSCADHLPIRARGGLPAPGRDRRARNGGVLGRGLAPVIMLQPPARNPGVTPSNCPRPARRRPVGPSPEQALPGIAAGRRDVQAIYNATFTNCRNASNHPFLLFSRVSCESGL